MSKKELENLEEQENENIVDVDVPEEDWNDEHYVPEEPAEKVGFFKKLKCKAKAFGEKHPKGIAAAKTAVGAIALLGLGIVGGVALSERKKLTGEVEALPDNCDPFPTLPGNDINEIPEPEFEEFSEPEAQIEESAEG